MSRWDNNWSDDEHSYNAPLIDTTSRKARHIIEHVRAGGRLFSHDAPPLEPFELPKTPEPTTELGIWIRDELTKRGYRV